MKSILTKLFCAFAALAFGAFAAFGAFKYETTLTVGGYTGDETLADFPLLVRISSTRISGFSYDKCQTDGKDIAFTSADGATTYPHEIDEWNTDGESLVWVKVPLAKSMTLVMKFGDSSLTTSTEDAASVWSDYTGVWHMNETEGEGTTDFTAYDSTANKLDLTASGPAAEIVNMTHQTGGFSAGGYAGIGRKLGDLGTWNTGNLLSSANKTAFDDLRDVFTVSCWTYYPKSVGGANQVVVMGRTAGPRTTGDGWRICLGDNGGYYQNGKTYDGTRQHYTSTSWHYMTFVYNDTSAAMYYGNSAKTFTLKDAATAPSSFSFSLGNNSGHHYNGGFDELRIRKGAATSARVSAEYANMTTSDYVTFGAVEELAAANTLSVTADADHAQFSFNPKIGTSTLTAGEVTCTATADEIEVEKGKKVRISGWTLTQVSASGAKTTTEGTGATCTFTHEEGGGAAIVWHYACTYKATVTSSNAEKGSVTGDGWYAEGTTATITASVIGDNYFAGWEGDVPEGEEKSTTLSLTMDEPKTLNANFSDKPTYTVSVTSADSTKGSVSGGGAIKLGDEAMLVATPKEGYRFAGWTGTLPTGCTAQNAGLNFEVTDNVELTATFEELVTYTFTNAVLGANNAYWWSEKQNWLDITGDGVGDIPPNDGTARVKIIYTTNKEIMLDYGATKVYGLYFAGKGKATGANWNPRHFVIGAGGVDGDAGATMPDFSYQGCDLVSSQTWHLKSNGIGSKAVRTSSEVVLTISGPYTTSLEFSGFTGKLKTNVGMGFPTDARAMEVFNHPGEDGVASSITMNEGIFHWSYTADGGTITTPVTMDITNNVPVTIKIGCAASGFSWIYDFAGRWTGNTAEDGSSLLTFSSDYPTILSDIGRVVFSGASSGLSNMKVKTTKTMIELGGPNAAFADGSCSFQISAGGSRGYLGGLLLGDGIKLNRELYMNPYREWQTGGLSDAQIAMNGPGTIDLYGRIVNTNETKYSLGGYASYFSSSAGQLQFYAPEGATINVNNEIVGAMVLPVRILGDGVVAFKHANEKMVKAPIVQSGTLQVAAENATGSGTISLGVPCPSSRKIAAMALQNSPYVGTINESAGTYSDLKKSMFDGYQPGAGDTILLNFHTGTTGLYELTNATQFAKLPTAKVNSRVTVQNGAHFGGCSYFSVSGGGIWHKESAKAEPDCALLGAKGVTIANDIIVADNKSAGARTLGVADASTVTFSGDIILSNGVTVAAAAGGTALFTGKITDAEGTKQTIGVNGLGTVKLPDIDWSGRTLDCSKLDTSALEEAGLRSVTLLRANGVASATVIQPAVTGKYSLRVGPNTVRVSCGGFTMIVR